MGPGQRSRDLGRSDVIRGPRELEALTTIKGRRNGDAVVGGLPEFRRKFVGDHCWPDGGYAWVQLDDAVTDDSFSRLAVAPFDVHVFPNSGTVPMITVP